MFSITEDEDEAMIQLMQKSTRGKDGSENTTIGFTIMKVGGSYKKPSMLKS